jgi:hypothetical protein
MRKLIIAGMTVAGIASLVSGANAQQYDAYYGYGTSGYPIYGGQSRGYASQRALEHGRYTATDVGTGALSFGAAAPDPVVGNNTSRGTDNRGIVDPPSRDRDIVDAFKKVH